jgi:hypothetical protein
VTKYLERIRIATKEARNCRLKKHTGITAKIRGDLGEYFYPLLSHLLIAWVVESAGCFNCDMILQVRGGLGTQPIKA